MNDNSTDRRPFPAEVVVEKTSEIATIKKVPPTTLYIKEVNLLDDSVAGMVSNLVTASEETAESTSGQIKRVIQDDSLDTLETDKNFQERIKALVEEGRHGEALDLVSGEYEQARKSGINSRIYNSAYTAATINMKAGRFGPARNFSEIALRKALEMQHHDAIVMARASLSRSILKKDGLRAAKVELLKWLNENTVRGLLICRDFGKVELSGDNGELAKFFLDFAIAHEKNPRQALHFKMIKAVATNNLENSRAFAKGILLFEPDSLPARETILLADLGQDLISEESRDMALAVLAKKNDHAPAKFVMAKYFLKKGQFEEADRLMEELQRDGHYTEEIAKILADRLPKQQTPPAPVILPTLTNGKNGDPRREKTKAADPLTRAKTVLAVDTHEATLDKWKTLVESNSDKWFSVGRGKKGFDYACMRKDQLLLVEVKSINTSHCNERDEMVLAVGQLDLYARSYIKRMQESADKKIKRLILLSKRPHFLSRADSPLNLMVKDAEEEGAYYLLWFEDGELKGSPLAMAAYEDYLTC